MLQLQDPLRDEYSSKLMDIMKTIFQSSCSCPCSLPKYIYIVLCHFKFQKQDMDLLLEALQIPDSYTSHQGSVFTDMESLMILLRRTSYPNRWCDLVPIFGRTEPELSMAFDMVIMKHLNVHKQGRCITHPYRIMHK